MGNQSPGFLAYVGGKFSGMTITLLVLVGSIIGGGLSGAIAIVVIGKPLDSALADLFTEPPPSLQYFINGWFGLYLTLFALFLLWFAFRYNVWTQRQKAVTELAEAVSRAINNIFNGDYANDPHLRKLAVDYEKWNQEISTLLNNRAFFSRADQLHIERLGGFPFAHRSDANEIQRTHDWYMGMLNEKFVRIREIVLEVQSRGR
jgi:hypothetical protein